MKIIIDPKSRPCPGVDRILDQADNILSRGEVVYSVGELIHNNREVTRLVEMGLQLVNSDFILKFRRNLAKSDPYFLIRAHGEAPQTIQAAQDAGMSVLDGTCPIVKHSQEIVAQHAREGWRVLVAGKPGHAETIGLVGYAQGNGEAISSVTQAKTVGLESRTLLLAQSTISPELFTEIRKALIARMSGLKIVDTTCRFIGNRRKDVRSFAEENDAVILVGGQNSSNCRLLCQTMLEVNPNVQHIESGETLAMEKLENAETVGITGGASTPSWQIAELKSFLEATQHDNNPQGLKNTKGGNILWRIWKNQSKTA